MAAVSFCEIKSRHVCLTFTVQATSSPRTESSPTKPTTLPRTSSLVKKPTPSDPQSGLPDVNGKLMKTFVSCHSFPLVLNVAKCNLG